VRGLLDPVRVYRELDRGATIVLQGLQRYWPPLAGFCRDLELELGHPVQANAYVTPPGARGLAVHSDDHDVFVLQCFGRKRWLVYRPAAELPPADPPEIETDLVPGDALYIPRRFPHVAETQEAASVHVTIGILALRWSDVLKEAIDAATAEEGVDEPLPIGFAEGADAFREAIAERVGEWARGMEKVDAAGVERRLSRRFLTTRQPALAGQLERVLRLGSLSDGSVVRRRRRTFCVIERRGEEISLLLGDRELRMPARVEKAVRTLASGDEIRVADLAIFLDESGRSVLVKRLVREGLLEVVD
jgi:hypothetical protein